MNHRDMLNIIGVGVVFLSLSLVISACGKSSSSSGTDTASTTDTTLKCEKTGTLYTGCYTEGSVTGASWTGACKLDSVDSGEYVYLNFKNSSKCAFTWIRAKGEVGKNWESLGTGSQANWTGAEFVIQHSEEKVYKLRLCVNGVDDVDEKYACL